MFYIIDESDLVCILCYSDSNSDEQFANQIINELEAKGFNGCEELTLPGIPGTSKSTTFEYSIDKLFFFIDSEDFFESNGQNMLSEHIVHKNSKTLSDTSNYEIDIVAIPITRKTAEKVDKNLHSTFDRWNSIDSCIGPSNIAKLIPIAYKEFRNAQGNTVM